MILNVFENYKPNPCAVPFHDSKARFKAVGAGARGGKTHAGGRDFFDRVLADRERKTDKLQYWCCAPTYPLTRVQETELRNIIPRDLIKKDIVSERRLELYGEISIDFKSTDKPQNLVAVGLDGLWVDEAARVKPDAWRGQLRMRLSDRLGWALFTSTPLGRNWFWTDICAKSPKNGGDDIDYDFFTWTTADNVAVPELVVEVEKARKELPPAYFRREYEADFDAFHGQIYEEWDEDVHVWFFDKHGAVPEYHDVHYAFDPGFRHFGSLAAFLHLNDGLILRTGEVAKKGKIPEWWVDRAVELQDKFGAGTIHFDPSRPEYGQLFYNAGLHAQKANNAVNAGIEAVAKALHPIDGVPGFMVTEDCKLAREQMPSYRWAENEAVEKPLKEDDDACDEIRYGLYMPQAGVGAYE